MVDLFSRNRKHSSVIDVFDKMRKAGYFPDSNVIALVLNAYGKLREFDKANDVYIEMQDEGCVFPDEVHFQTLSLNGAKRDFKMLESLFERLDGDSNIKTRRYGEDGLGGDEPPRRRHVGVAWRGWT
ncbi:putative tetratricopeptide-like helical domain superfamily [Helianthus annuus]|nr:putative tetratricopeptide-like helical domain superfamily [Helianthus annuus]